MSFLPVIPIGGNAGWAFLQRTRDSQQDAFTAGQAITRDKDYFRHSIGEISNAEDLVSDRRLLRVALGAFGLDADIDSKYFVKKVLEGGSFNSDSLANRLSDKRYLDMARTFGFGDVDPPHSVVSSFPDKILAAYESRQFEAAVGAQDPTMRLALGLERDLAGVLDRGLSQDGMWFTVMATPPLRTVFERAFSLPIAVGTLDIDRQLEIFKDKAAAVFGDSGLDQFSNPDKVDELRRLFLARSELQSVPSGSVRGAVALAILQSPSASLTLPGL